MKAPADLLFEGIGRGLSAVAVAADPDLPGLLRESEGRRLALVVRGADRVLEVEVRGGSLRVMPPRRLKSGASAAGSGPEAAGAEHAPLSSGAPPTRDADESSSPPSPPSTDAPEPAGSGDPAAPPPGPEDASDLPADADLVLAGNVPEFVRFLLAIRSDPRPDNPFGPLEAHGSAAARDGFVDLLRRIDLDYEALVARAAGGIVAHALARTTAGRLFQARRAAATLVDDFTEYLEEESRLMPDPAARTRFAGGVQGLLDKVAELEGRLDRARPRD